MTRLVLLVVLLQLPPALTVAGEIHIRGRSAWEGWTYPPGVVELRDDGGVGLHWFRRGINAVADANQFEHESKDLGGLVRGGIHEAGSNEAGAWRAIDGDSTSYWQPAADEPLDNWWLQIDLGRAVLATRLRLVFPDTEQVRPFRSFSVYISDGSRVVGGRDLFEYTRVGGTTEPNVDRVLEFPLRTIDPGEATGEHLSGADTLAYALVQYVYFLVEAPQPDGAIAEIEVDALGDNLALFTRERGGSIVVGADESNSSAIFDGDMNTRWSVVAVKYDWSVIDWELQGHWFEWDLGATFWLDQLVLVDLPPPFDTGWRNTPVDGFAIFTSGGEVASGLTKQRVQSDLDYRLLSHVTNLRTPRQYKFDFHFPRRKVRHLFYHLDTDRGHTNFLYDIMLFGEGYPASAEMASPFIDLGRQKEIRRIEWDADLPPGTGVQVRSRTGQLFEVETNYYNTAGVRIPEELWRSLPSRLKLPAEEIVRAGTDWSGWSPVYLDSDKEFLSPNPTRYVQLQATLSTEDPEVAPILRSISLFFDDPLISGGLSGRILPRQAPLDSLTQFSYLIRPLSQRSDRGFDRIAIRLPSPAQEVSIWIGGRQVEDARSRMTGDSLEVELPRFVRDDSVEVRFRTRLYAAVTSFDSWVGDSRLDATQRVKPEDPEAAIVYVPAIADDPALMRQLEITPGICTPNGDGINDEVSIRLTVVKVERPPTVEILTLSGSRATALEPVDGGYTWNGTDSMGRLMPPGTYICRIHIDADAGDQVVHRLIGLVY